MLTRETLEQMSESELETLYQEKKDEYDQRMSKNKRIREILERRLRAYISDYKSLYIDKKF